MTITQKFEKLATEKNSPCVTISLNTHRTHPDNAQDVIQLKVLLKEAEERLINEFDKKSIEPLLEKLFGIEVDANYNLDSLHIFLSNDTKEIIKSPWSTQANRVQISDAFDIRSLIKSLNRSEEYLILLLTQSGVNLYNTINDGIINEKENNDFPFPENPNTVTDRKKRSDGELMDNIVREYFNNVDKAVVKVYNETGLNCVVICTEDNYSRLMQVADKPSIYIGYSSIDYNNTARHNISQQAWELVKSLQENRRVEAIEEMEAAVGLGLVLTDLGEILQASIDGRGDLLIVNQDFSQPVLMTGESTFELITDGKKGDAIDDLTSRVAWEVSSKKGRVFFVEQDEIKEFGNIVLKTRY